MNLIDRYIAKEFIIYFLVCSLSLITIAVAFAALAEIPSLQEVNGTQVFINSILSGIPLLIEVIAPISVLLATVLTYISLSKTSEIIAMMAAGVTIVRLVIPVMVTVCGLVFLLYLNQSYLAPYLGADQRASLVKKRVSSDIWQFHKGDLFHFSSMDKRKKRVEEVGRYSFDSDSTISTIAIYKRVGLSETWDVDSVREISVGDSGVKQSIKADVTYDRADFPVVFKKEITAPKYSSFGQLINEIEIKSKGAVPIKRELFALYQKGAGMISVFVMVLLALPFSVYGARSANVRTGIVISVVLGFIFWLVDQLLASFSDTASIPLVLSAFGANILFIALAILLIRLKQA